jgi:ATP-dependent Clp protease ATP-binding subunit ClpA
MFERFTREARAVVIDAQQQARRLGHNYIGCEHVLLAVAASESVVAATLHERGVTPARVEQAVGEVVGGSLFESLDKDALAAIGIDLSLVRDKIEAAFGPEALRTPPHRRRRRWRQARTGDKGRGHIPFTPAAKKCLQLSLREALALHSRSLGVEHIALGLTVMPDGPIPRIFAAIGVSPVQLHTELVDRHRQAG